ncbi:Ferrous iron transport protein B [Richelia intracellularis]|nr:Ferrous iron transport protein B [Richelia intracellularis]
MYLIGIVAGIFTGLVMELPPYHIPHPKGVIIRAWDRLKGFLIRAGKVIVLMVMILS